MIKRNAIRQRIHSRIREKLAGTGERPRLNVYRSLNHIYAQVIDDQKGETLVSASTLHQVEDRRQCGGGQGDRQSGGREGSWRRASRRWSSIAAAFCITAASRRWPMRRAKQDWNSKSSYQLSVISGQLHLR